MTKNVLHALVAGFFGTLFVASAWAQDPMASASVQTPAKDVRGVVVFYLDDKYRPVARLDRLGTMSEGVKAILAMYALQDAGGCDSTNGREMQCVLTESLGLGSQCSEEQIQLVSTWFKDGMPNMGIYGEGSFQKALKDRDFRSLCSQFPETSGIQAIWELIRVRQDGNHVHIDAVRDFMISPDKPDRETKYETEYSIKSGDIVVLSHTEELVKKKGDQP